MAENDQRDAERRAEEAQAEVTQRLEAEHEQGYAGVKVDPRPNEAYSLETGPESPSASEAALDGARQRIGELEPVAGDTNRDDE